MALATIAIVYRLRKATSTPENYLAPEAKSHSLEWGDLWVYEKNLEPQSTPILLIHGLGSSMYSWRYVHELLGDYPFISIDLPGFGKSHSDPSLDYGLEAQTQRLLDYIYSKEINSCYLVGCSMGGTLALWMSYKYPKLFPKTITISPAAIPTLVPFNEITSSRLGSFAPKIVNRSMIKVALRRGVTRKELITREVIEDYFSPYTSADKVQCFFKSLSLIRDPRVFESLDQRTTPSLILWGKKDKVIRKKEINKIANQTKLCEIQIHDWGGHHLMEDDPDWVVEKISNFLRI